MSVSRLTCLVPTHNRPHFLRRLLRFHLQFPTDYPFLVVDSSASHLAAENRTLIDEMPGRFQIEYIHLDLNFMDKCVTGLERIQTPFVALCADDDYLFPDAVTHCADFLECHPDYASAMGRTAMLSVDQPIWRCRVLKGYSVEQEQPFDRCQQIARSWFNNLYAVYRTPELLDSFRITAANTDPQRCPHLFELLLSHLNALHGRVKLLPLMYSLREQHGSNAGKVLRNKNEPQAEQLYLRFKACLAEQLNHYGVDRVEAERFIEVSHSRPDRRKLSGRQPRSPIESLRKFYCGVTERMADYFSADRTRHRRFVRSSDLAGCESIWRHAVELMREFPQGIPADCTPRQRAA